MKKRGVGTFVGAAFIGLMIIDWFRTRLFIERVSGYVEGAGIVLKDSSKSKDEKEA